VSFDGGHLNNSPAVTSFLLNRQITAVLQSPELDGQNLGQRIVLLGNVLGSVCAAPSQGRPNRKAAGALKQLAEGNPIEEFRSGSKIGNKSGVAACGAINRRTVFETEWPRARQSDRISLPGDVPQ
jgi:hypothetical protein